MELLPLTRPQAAQGLHPGRMRPPGSGSHVEGAGDGVELSRDPPPEEKTPRWKRPALIGLGVLGFLGVAVQVGPSLGPALFHSQQSTDQLVEAMLAEPGSLTPKERTDLRASLKTVRPEVLRLLQQHGLKIHVLRPGDDLLATGALREQSSDAVSRRLAQIHQFRDRLQVQLEERFDRPMQELDQRRQELTPKDQPLVPAPMLGLAGFGGPATGMFGAPAPKSELDRVQAELGQLHFDRIRFQFEAASEAGLGVKPFSFPVTQVHGFMPFGMAAQIHSNFPTTLYMMAEIHGAKTPEQKAEFYRLVELINGPRLDRARQEGVQSLRDMAERLKGQPPTQGGLAEYRPEVILKAAERYPERIPIDHRKHAILVPDLFFTEVGGQVHRFDEHDRGTAQDWLGADGRVSTGRDEDGEAHGTMGQFFHLDWINR
ncbi:MAG: hypothetical protein AB1758_01670, partial [Candidatus Eremiobacterota bacterium]